MVVAGFLLMIAAESYAQYNPILMIGFVPPKFHYEILPQDIKNKCIRAIGPYKTDPFEVFAHIKNDNYEYYAEWGTNKNQKDDEYDQGATLLEIHGSECKAWDIDSTLMAIPPRNGYHGSNSETRLPGPTSPTENTPLVRNYVFRSAEEESLLRSFIKDAIQRAIKAYNSEKLFRIHACPPKLAAEFGDGGYPIVMQELKAYCAVPPTSK
jgi:hypothetical protein